MKDSDKLESLIKNLVSKTMTDTINNTGVEASNNTLPYSTIEEYKAQTGKRFRMTREQKERNLSREDAFQEFLTKKQSDTNQG